MCKDIRQNIKSVLNTIKEWCFTRSDKCMGKFDRWMFATFHVSLAPTQSRWGFIALLFTVSLFFVSLFPSVLAIHLSDTGGDLMPLSWTFWLAIALGIFGLLVLIFAICLSHYLLGNPKDTFTEDINQIKTHTDTLPKMGASLEEISDSLKGIKDKIGGKDENSKSG